MEKIIISLQDIADAMDWHASEGHQFLNIKTGEVVVKQDDDAEVLDDLDLNDDNGSDTDGESIHEVGSDEDLGEADLIPIPTIESHETYMWMEMFTERVKDAELKEKLNIAMSGPGGFRRFKETLVSNPQDRQAWHDFYNKKLLNEARKWLDTNYPDLLRMVE